MPHEELSPWPHDFRQVFHRFSIYSILLLLKNTDFTKVKLKSDDYGRNFCQNPIGGFINV